MNLSKLPLKSVLTILRKRYGEKLVDGELAKWDGRQVKDFKLYFMEICRRAYNMELEKKIEYEGMVKKAENRIITKEGQKILDQILIKDIFREREIDDKRELDRKNKILLSSRNENKNIPSNRF